MVARPSTSRISRRVAVAMFGAPSPATSRHPRVFRVILSLIAFIIGGNYGFAQVQNISAWTLDTFDNADVTVGGITYLNNYATPLTVTTAIGTYNAGTAGAGADDVFIRRNTATPTSTSNVAGQAVSILSSSSGGSTVYGTYNATMQDLLLGGNVLNSTWDTFANTSSGAGNVGHNIERIDFVWSNGYTTVGDEVIIVFNFDPIGAQDDFRVAVFTGIDNTANKLPTAYANTGVLVSGTNYPDKLPLPLAGSPLSSTSTGFRTTTADDLSGTALNRGDSQTVGIGGVAISLATLGISAGQTIYGYSLISTDTNASTAANLLDFTNSSLYPTTTANADATGTADFSTFGGRIATIVTNTGSAAFEWDGQAGTNKWGTTVGGESNTNWYSSVSTENNRTPFRDGDVIFGNRVSSNQTVDLDNNVEVRSMTFDSAYNYTIGVAGDTPKITFGDPNLAGLPSIDITAVNGDYAEHKINANIDLTENLSINNNTYSVLCINGTIETLSSLAPDGNNINVTGTGTVNFNGDISGAGDLIKTGSGIATINNNNSDDPAGTATPWIGNVTVAEGQLVITADGALGGSVNRTNDLARTAGNTTLQLANANATDLKVGQLVSGTNIAAGTYITSISVGATETTITLSNALTGSVTNTATITFAGATTVNSGATLTLRADNVTGTPLNYTATETITLNGTGIARGSEYAGALFNDGGNNTLGANVSLRLGSDAAIGSRADNLTINGVISGAYSLTKLGAGVVTLANSANSYTGATIIQGGALRITTETALPGGFSSGAPSGGNLTLNGGVLEIGTATTFARRLGTAADQVQFTGDGGFSAYGAARTVTLTNSTGTAGGTLTWNAGSFVPTGNALLLSSSYSDNTVTLTNAINLGGAQREVRVANGSAAVDGILSGVLSNGGLIKTGAGTLNLSGTNTYTGATEIRGGALRGNVPSSSNLTLNGGVMEINSSFTRSLGSGGTNVQWTGDGGFAAYTNNSSVSLNNNSNAVTWGSTAGFIGSGKTLIFGSVSADKTLTFNNAINLNAGSQTIQVVSGTTAGIANGILAGVVSNGSLTVIGNGRLDSTAANTLAGTVTVKGAELRLQGAGTMASVTGLTVGEGGTFTLDNATTNNTNRLNNSAGVTLSGGTLSFLGNNTTSSETLGALTLSAGGGNTVTTQHNGANSAVLTFGSLTRNAGSTVDFTNGSGGGTLGTTGTNPRTVFTTAPTLTNGILAYATVNGTAFAGYGTVDGTSPDGIYAVTSTNTAEGSWTSSINTGNTGDVTVTANRTVNSLNLGSGIDVAINSGFKVNLASGGILSTGTTGSIISGGTLTAGGAGAGEIITHVYGTGGLTISSTLANNGANVVGLTKTGTGTLTLSGSTANTNTGTTYVNDGTLILAKSNNVTALAGNITIGDGRGTDVLQINANEQIADTANVTLHGNTYGGGETKLSFGGTTEGVTETFASLTIEGTAVLDFAGGTVCSPNYLYLSALNIPSDGLLLVRNWIEFTDFLLIDSSVDLASILPRIQFEGYSTQAYVGGYNSGWNQIRPVPEPSTYGLMMMSGGLAFYGFRRWRKAKSALQDKA